jgi:S-formylglutathione hydrolase FrmB
MKRSLLLNWTHLISLVGALLAGLILFLGSTRNSLSAAVVATGIDTARADFIAALLLASAAALVGAFLGQSRSGAIAGAGIVFGRCYLARFVHTALQPVYDPAGNLEQLHGMMLFYRSLTIAALALICSFIGAAVGSVLAHVVLDPLAYLLKMLWRQKRYQTSAFQPLKLIGDWLKALILVALFALAMGSRDLFLYAPDVNLHTAHVKVQNGIKRDGTIPSHDTVLQYGTIKTDYFVSQSSNQAHEFLLYLPPSYSLAQAQTKRYPVLYLLHGSPGGARDWLVAGQANTSADMLIAVGSIHELILVLPDGNGRPGMTSEWADSFDQTQRIETFVSKELVNYVDLHYRTLADAQHRAIGGLSMGGFGAMNIAIHHPDVFGSVLSFGGYYDAEGAIWGKNTAYQQANSPLLTIGQKQEAHKLHIYLGAASEDQPYYNDTRQFAQALDELHIPYAFDILPGHHAWNIWQSQLYHALRWLPWNAEG